MSQVDPELVAALRELIRPQPPTAVDADVKTIELDFDAGGLPLAAGMRTWARLPYPCRITGAYAYTDVASASVFSLALGTSADWPSTSPIAPTSPFSMGGLVYVPFDVTTWIRELQRADVLDCRLTAVASGITHLLVAIDIRKGPSTQRSLAVQSVGDSSGSQVVDSLGNPVVSRG